MNSNPSNHRFRSYADALAESVAQEHRMITPDQIRNSAKHGTPLRAETLMEIASRLESAERITSPASTDALVKRLQHHAEYPGLLNEIESAALFAEAAAGLSAQPEAQAVAWLAEEQGYYAGEGRRELWFKPNEHAVQWKQTPLYTAPPSATIRRQAIEECAKVCEELAEGKLEKDCDAWPESQPNAVSGAEQCAAAIRSLAAHPAAPGKET